MHKRGCELVIDERGKGASPIYTVNKRLDWTRALRASEDPAAQAARLQVSGL